MIRARWPALALILTVAAASPARAEPSTLAGFVQAARPTVGQQHFVAGLKVPGPVGRLLGKLHLGRHRQVVQVTDQTLAAFTRATARGYLEVVVPANRGHVYFRHGNEVFDFYPGGFRSGPVRPINGERYGMLIPLTADQEGRLGRYLDRLKRTGGQELGTYDFTGERGYHCVTWMLREALGGGGENLVQLLGGRAKHGTGMPGFSRFLLKRARPVEAVVVYQNQPRTSSQLGRMKLELMSLRELVRAFRQERRDRASR
jgi:hypothetical protein